MEDNPTHAAVQTATSRQGRPTHGAAWRSLGRAPRRTHCREQRAPEDDGRPVPAPREAPGGLDRVEAAERAGLATRTPQRAVATRRPTRTTARFAHTCTVCQFRRIANRRVTTWRCPDCYAAGLPGDLAIEKLA